MYQQTYSASFTSLRGFLLRVECLISGGLPGLTIIGLPASCAVSCRERIRGALKHAGFSLPASRITINIRSMETPEEISPLFAPYLDLPIALSILSCQKLIPPRFVEEHLWLGELSLSGEVKSLTGALLMARCAQAALPSLKGFFLPAQNAPEASLCRNLKVYPVTDLLSVIDMIRKGIYPSLQEPSLPDTAPTQEGLFDEIMGQSMAKRALTIACAGSHNLLLIGPPGCGKTMLSSSAPSLLSPLTEAESLELTEIYSGSGQLKEGQSLITERPFRSPHHSISQASLIGGGRPPIAGEVTLAHRGVLFLDEFPEMDKKVLEALREPLEDHHARISRVGSSVAFPADFMLLAGMNPCPCGYYPEKRCKCPESRIRDYYRKIDSPLLDRFDMVIRMSSVRKEEMYRKSGLTLSEARDLVKGAEEIQRKRFPGGIMKNSRMSAEEVAIYCQLSHDDRQFFSLALERMGISMRGAHRILKVARTIADLEASATIKKAHLLEALQYRININEQS